MTAATRPRSIQALLYAAPPTIAATLKQVSYLARIHAAVVEALPADVVRHVKTAAWRDRCLRLHVDSGAWATRLRYLQPTIARALARQMRLHLDTLDVRVRPADFAVRPSPPGERRLSEATRRNIRGVAAGIDDPALAAALGRLAAAGEPTAG